MGQRCWWDLYFVSSIGNE